MKMKSLFVSLCLAVALSAAGARVEANDAWITTKAKLALMTTDGIHVSTPNVDTVNGNVTLHGKVRTAVEKQKAEDAVKTIDGVRTVKNLLQVVPKSEKKVVDTNDAHIKDRVEATLKTDASLKDVSVASVNKGVVLLSGKTKTLGEKLQAVEKAYNVDGVLRVATEIEAGEN
jgi:osmotically-inducible protein OsmY